MMNLISHDKQTELIDKVNTVVRSMIQDENISLIEVIEEYGEILKEIIGALRE